MHISPPKALTKISLNIRMALHHSSLALPRKAYVSSLGGSVDETGCAGLSADSGCWSGLNPFRSSYESRHALDDQQTFSPIGTSAVARLFLTRTPPETDPSTVVWASPQPAWGQWPCHSFSHCISVVTERDARVAYVFDASPLPPVYECTLDGAGHLWLVVPSRPSAGGLVQLSTEQMLAAMAFYERTGAVAAPAAEAGVSPSAAKVLCSCADGNEVDAVALAVLLVAHHSRRCDSWPPPWGQQHGAHFGRSGSGPAYDASRLIEEDPGVSHIWKGLLEWKDVERVEAALRMHLD
ncbi:hypothetical protein BC826DRAFT_1188263 [Russula brevipes]|nr:hypothetical protein BC826DRAFT_1188263 [Russula brevipes]